MIKNRLNFLIILLSVFVSIDAIVAQRTLGLFTNTSDAFNGYTLYAPSGSNGTYLLNNCGELINQWTSPTNPGLSVYLLPNGDILRTKRVPGQFFGGGVGGGFEIRNWDDLLEFEFIYANDDAHQHHDVEYLSNGNVLVLAWEKILPTDAANIYGVNNPNQGNIWPEHIIEVNPDLPVDSNIVWEWHFIDHIIQDVNSFRPNYGVVAEHLEKIDVNYQNMATESRDFIHCNSIDYNERLDQIMINSLNYGEFWVIDHSTTTEEAAGHSGGKYQKGGDILYRWGNPHVYQMGTMEDRVFYGQHDAHWIPEDLPNGNNIMVFNNGQGIPGIVGSKVQILKPPENMDGSYAIDSGMTFGPEEVFFTIDSIPGEANFYAARVSGAQMQPNGNVLICDGPAGELYEVTPDQKLSWKYFNPVRNNDPLDYNSNFGAEGMFRAYRYGPDYSAFENKDLTPGDVLELNVPDGNDCTVFLQTSISKINFLTGVDIILLNNSEIEIQQEIFEILDLQLFDMQGRVLHSNKINQNFQKLTLINLIQGIYIIRLTNSSGKVFIKKVFIG